MGPSINCSKVLPVNVEQNTVSQTDSSLRRIGLRRLLAWSLVSLAILALIIWWVRIPWTWSPVDDAGHVNAVGELVRTQGFISAFTSYTSQQFRADLDWGLFRPSYWAYPAFVYVLSSEGAHVVRLLMAFVAIAGPLIYFRRTGIRGPQFIFATAVLLAAGSSLYVGLFLISLQELSGAAFVGLGLALRNRWIRLAAWTIAAWFKAPFAWLLIGQAIVDWRMGRRALAISNGGIGVITLGIAAVMARSGGYTRGYGFDPFMMWHNLQVLLEPMNSLLLVALVWWLAITRLRLDFRITSIGFFVGWAGYTAQLLPWFVSAYYMGPISYLFGIFLISMLPTQAPSPTRVRSAIGLLAPTTIAVILVSSPLIFGFQLQNAMKTFQDCLIDRPGKTSVLHGHMVYLTSSPEGPIRLEQNLRLLDPDWTGQISLRDPAMSEEIDTSADLVLNVGWPLDTSNLPLVLECEGPNAQVYRTS